MKIITICGSTRRHSSNLALLESYSRIASEDAEVSQLSLLSELPHFDPDIDDTTLPAIVSSMRAIVHSADLLVFSTPEYIHALPAILKNLLEWLVGDPRFYQKPVVILRTNLTSAFANESLLEVLTTMSARIIDEASVTIILSGSRATSEEILSNREWRRSLVTSFTSAANQIGRAEQVGAGDADEAV